MQNEIMKKFINLRFRANERTYICLKFEEEMNNVKCFIFNSKQKNYIMDWILSIRTKTATVTIISIVSYPC